MAGVIAAITRHGQRAQKAASCPYKRKKKLAGIVMSYTKLTGSRLAGCLLLLSVCAADAQGPESLKGTTISRHPLISYAPVTDAVLRHPDVSDWIMMRGNYEGWGYSSLDQINKANV